MSSINYVIIIKTVIVGINTKIIDAIIT